MAALPRASLRAVLCLVVLGREIPHRQLPLAQWNTTESVPPLGKFSRTIAVRARHGLPIPDVCSAILRTRPPAVEPLSNAALRIAAPLEHDPRPHTAAFSATVFASLGIELVLAARDVVVVRTVVSPAVRQPAGLLHGGVSALLIETAASIGAGLHCSETARAMGVELNASHLRSAHSGPVLCIARPVRAGRTMHVWNGQIIDEHDRLVSEGRCTLQIIDLSTPTSGREPARQ